MNIFYIMLGGGYIILIMWIFRDNRFLRRSHLQLAKSGISDYEAKKLFIKNELLELDKLRKEE